MGYTGFMQNKFIPVLIGVILIGGTFGLAYLDHQKTPAPAPVPQANDESAAYAPSEVATHRTADDCWAIINGGVYDLTSWISRHPGGARAIEGLCGKDGSAAFNAQHGGGAAQEAILAELKLGIVK
jgi:cytochrome b involved in lipid metabolism